MGSISLKGTILAIAVIASAAFLIATMANVSEAGARPHYDKHCGITPGDFAYGYVRAKNTSCARARAVTTRATKKFCARHDNCTFLGEAALDRRYKGTLYRNGWKCKVTVAITYWRSKCRRGNMRVIGRAAIF